MSWSFLLQSPVKRKTLMYAIIRLNVIEFKNLYRKGGAPFLLTCQLQLQLQIWQTHLRLTLWTHCINKPNHKSHITSLKYWNHRQCGTMSLGQTSTGRTLHEDLKHPGGNYIFKHPAKKIWNETHSQRKICMLPNKSKYLRTCCMELFNNKKD